jgi:hypothetical protein
VRTPEWDRIVEIKSTKVRRAVHGAWPEVQGCVNMGEDLGRG